jgi:hypothetical protein
MTYYKENMMELQNKANQETYFLGLVKRANWTREQVEQLFLSKFCTSQWDDLTQNDKRRAIAIMKHFVNKATELKEKKLRQLINAIWIKAGYTRDELHELMFGGGYGVSLRSLKHKELVLILRMVQG